MSIKDIKHSACPGIGYLRTMIRQALDRSPPGTVIKVDDGEDQHVYLPNMIEAALKWATDIDGEVTYKIGPYFLCVIYDGPYDRDNREEIVYNGNDKMMELSEIVDAIYAKTKA